MKPLISVVIPVYNVEKYVERCVYSIINQTYAELEIILVDDGSMDGSGRLCDDMSFADSRIKVIHKRNGGLSDARNAGIEIAKGKYIFFIDSDDWIEKETIDYLYQLILTYECDIAICGYTESDGTPQNDLSFLNQESHIIKYKTNEESLNALIHDGNRIGIVVWNKLYKREIFDNLKFKYGVIHEDVFFTPKALYYAKSIVSSDIKLYHYFVGRTDNIMKQPLSKKNLDSIWGFKDNAIFFENKNQQQSYIYWMKYYSTMIDLYCRFIERQQKDIGKEILNLIKTDFHRQLNICFKGRNSKELIRSVFFRLSNNLYFKIWSIKNGK